MARYSNSGGRPRGNRGGSREGRGRRDFTEMGGHENEREFSGYHTRSRDYEQQRYYPNEESTRGYSGSSKYSEGFREVWKGNPRNKNTNVEYFYRIASPFSQFHPASFEIKNDTFVCAEQYMMWNKARVFNDQRSCKLIMQAKEPQIMKKYGRGVENFDPDIWDMCCRQIVQEGNTAKFSQNLGLLEQMLSTESKYFAEASPGDKKWGIGMEESNPLSNNPKSWRGSNWLGKALNTVKCKFQLIIFLAMKGECIKQAPKADLFDLFEIGTSEYFEKMGCKILIEKSEEEIFTDAPSRNRSGKKHKQTKLTEKEESLAPNFDVQLPRKKDRDAESAKHKNITDEKKEKIGTEITAKDESIFKSENTQTVLSSGEEEAKDSKQMDDLAPDNKDCKGKSKKKKSPLPKIKSQSQQEYTQEKLKFKPTKIAFDSIPAKSNIPPSKQISCEYIFTDWARDRICNDITILNCFMRLPKEDLQELTGKCIYQTDNEEIGIGIRISYVLLKLKTEFDNLTRIFLGYSDYIKDFDCATNIPYPPTLGERVKIDPRTIMLPMISAQPDNPVRKKTRIPEDKPVLFPEGKKKTTQNEPDIQSTEVLQARTETPMKEDNEMSQEKLDGSLGEIKVTKDTQDTQDENNPDNPIAGIIPVKSATEETKPEIIQESSADVEREKQQEDIIAEKPETGMEQETILEKPETGKEQETIPEKPETGKEQETIPEKTETGKVQEIIPEKTETGKVQEIIPEKPETEMKQQTHKAEDLEIGMIQEASSVKNTEPENQPDITNEENPQTGKKQENSDETNSEIKKEQELTRAEIADTNINKLDNTGASEMDVSINSSLLDEDMNREEHKSKTNKCSPSKSLDLTDSAKRPKTAAQSLVSYDSSSNSDPDPAEDQNEQTKKGKKHLISEESIDNKRSKCETQSEMSLESFSPAENEMNESDEPKEKPEDCSSDKTGGNSKRKKKKKKTVILSTGLLYNKTK